MKRILIVGCSISMRGNATGATARQGVADSDVGDTRIAITSPTLAEST